MRLILRLPNNQKSGMPTRGNSKIAISHARLLAGDRRCLRIPATTSRANGIIKIPTATTVPAIAKLNDHAELNIEVASLVRVHFQGDIGRAMGEPKAPMSP